MLADSPREFLAGMRLMMLNMDPPQHTKLRALVNKGFTPRMVAERAGRIRDLARQIVDAVAPRGACDFVADVAGELPSYVIAELVGIPLDDGRLLYALTERMHTTTRTPEGMADAQAAVGAMMAYAAAVRSQPDRRSSSSTRRPTGTKRASPYPTASTSAGRQTSTWRSAGAGRTSASARASRGSRSARCSRRCSRASTRSSSTVRSSGCRPSSS